MTNYQTQVQTVQITCIIKPDRTSGCEGITRIGNSSRTWTRQEAIAAIEAGRIAFYTSVNGKTAWIGVNNGPTGRYLQTHSDGYWNNNLLALGQCW